MTLTYYVHFDGPSGEPWVDGFIETNGRLGFWPLGDWGQVQDWRLSYANGFVATPANSSWFTHYGVTATDQALSYRGAADYPIGFQIGGLDFDELCYSRFMLTYNQTCNLAVGEMGVVPFNVFTGIQFATVPEPDAGLLLCFGLIMTAFLKRFHRR